MQDSNDTLRLDIIVKSARELKIPLPVTPPATPCPTILPSGYATIEGQRLRNEYALRVDWLGYLAEVQAVGRSVLRRARFEERREVVLARLLARGMDPQASRRELADAVDLNPSVITSRQDVLDLRGELDGLASRIQNLRTQMSSLDRIWSAAPGPVALTES